MKKTEKRFQAKFFYQGELIALDYPVANTHMEADGSPGEI